MGHHPVQRQRGRQLVRGRREGASRAPGGDAHPPRPARRVRRALQTPPAMAGWTYGLMAVAVAKGTVAVAVGGNLQTPHTVTTTTGYDTSVTTGNGNGIILGTTTGGFSWTQLARGCRRSMRRQIARSSRLPAARARRRTRSATARRPRSPAWPSRTSRRGGSAATAAHSAVRGPRAPRTYRVLAPMRPQRRIACMRRPDVGRVQQQLVHRHHLRAARIHQRVRRGRRRRYCQRAPLTPNAPSPSQRHVQLGGGEPAANDVPADVHDGRRRPERVQ